MNSLHVESNKSHIVEFCFIRSIDFLLVLVVGEHVDDLLVSSGRGCHISGLGRGRGLDIVAIIAIAGPHHTWSVFIVLYHEGVLHQIMLLEHLILLLGHGLGLLPPF
jgi:hypothetical protein